MKTFNEILNLKNKIQHFSLKLYYVRSAKRIALKQIFNAFIAMILFWLPDFLMAKLKYSPKAQFPLQIVRRVAFRTRRTLPVLGNISI